MCGKKPRGITGSRVIPLYLYPSEGLSSSAQAGPSSFGAREGRTTRDLRRGRGRRQGGRGHERRRWQGRRVAKRRRKALAAGGTSRRKTIAKTTKPALGLFSQAPKLRKASQKTLKKPDKPLPKAEVVKSKNWEIQTKN